MYISIITINRNNKAGLKQTVQSVAIQESKDFEYIIVDGASTDGSTDVIQEYSNINNLRWISEPDTGIYNAMNKGILMATGEYVLMLNSGDSFTNQHVIGELISGIKDNDFPDILFGNTIKTWPNGKKKKSIHQNNDFSMMTFYLGTIDHVGTCIRRSLFSQFGMYDESLKICSDWAWFMKTIVFGNIKPIHINLDTIYFDMTGISESGGQNRQLIMDERRKTLQNTLVPSILSDYDYWGKEYRMIQRLHRHPWAYKLTHFIERCLFKIEKLKK